MRVQRDPKGTRITRWLSLAVLLAMFVPLAMLAQAQMAGQPPAALQIHQVILRMDAIGLLLAAVSLALGTLVVIFSWAYMAEEKGEGKFYALLLALVGHDHRPGLLTGFVQPVGVV